MHLEAVIQDITKNPFFVYCFGGLECGCHSFAYVAHLTPFCIFARCLDSNPEQKILDVMYLRHNWNDSFSNLEVLSL
jgi:hypothetical protein